MNSYIIQDDYIRSNVAYAAFSSEGLPDYVSELVGSEVDSPPEVPSMATTRFLRYPLDIVREYGPLSRTLAAFWTLREVRQYGMTHAGLDHIAKPEFSGVPVDTLKKQIAKLTKLGAIRKVDSVAVTRSVSKTRYKISDKVMKSFRDSDWLLVPTDWTGNFSEKMLLGYYHLRCGVWNGLPSYCLATLGEVSETLGMQRTHVGMIARKLEQDGKIIRKHTPNNNDAVIIPGAEPEYPLGEVLTGNRFRSRVENWTNDDTLKLFMLSEVIPYRQVVAMIDELKTVSVSDINRYVRRIKGQE